MPADSFRRIIRLFLGPKLLFWIRALKAFPQWYSRGFAAPSPDFIKSSVLLRNGSKNATWIETGTFQGDMTIILARTANHVYSVEPSEFYASRAIERFKSLKNVEIVLGTSQASLPEILKAISGKVNFWLDGHYSGGQTFQGSTDTPIISELQTISDNLHRFDDVVVMIDDVRCFSSNAIKFGHYPSVEELIGWAQSHDFLWHIEQDIFIASNR